MLAMRRQKNLMLAMNANFDEVSTEFMLGAGV